MGQWSKRRRIISESETEPDSHTCTELVQADAHLLVLDSSMPLLTLEYPTGPQKNVTAED